MSTCSAKHKAQGYPRSLRDHLLASLSTLPSSLTIRLTLLSSAPKRTTSLFPHVHHPPKCLEREYLITLSSDTESHCPSSPYTTTPAAKPTVLVSALSAHLYILPAASPPASILYISKVDSSGYSPLPLPFTRTLITSFIAYHVLSPCRPTERVFVQLFARSQGQYLFANSRLGGSKRVVGGLALCGWWKRVYEDVAQQLSQEVDLSYLLPSYSAQEAAGMLGRPRRPLPEGVTWEYKPPFSVSFNSASATATSLAMLIPSLPDDPKSRFLDELVAESAPHDSSPWRSKSKTDRKSLSQKERDAVDDEEDRRRAEAALGRVSAGEFWERMGFRQECASGDVTGFFTLSVGRASFASEKDGSGTGGEPKKSRSDLSLAILERLLEALLNVDFGSRGAAVEGSAIWLRSVEAIVRDEVGEEGWARCTGEVQGKVGLGAQVEAKVEKRKEEVVTVLQPRKKKK